METFGQCGVDPVWDDELNYFCLKLAIPTPIADENGLME